MPRYSVVPVGYIRSSLKARKEAPNFYTEGAPPAFLEVLARFRRGLLRVKKGEEIIVLTWLHLSRRDILRTHPQDDRRAPLTGVFLTRSPDRPNPIGLHRCRVREVTREGLRIGPIEAIDGTPVLDIKPVVRESADW